MMKYVFLFLIVAMLLLSACGGDDLEECVQLLNESEWLPTCDVCEVCEPPQPCEDVECPEPEKLECPACEVGDEPVELLLDDIELYSAEPRRLEDTVVAKFTVDEYDDIDTATLRFTPQCDSPGDLEIEIDDWLIYNEKPPCYQEVELPIDLARLDIGRNMFNFASEGLEKYSIVDIYLDVEKIDGTNESLTLYGVSFDPADTDRTQLKAMDDVSIKNFVEYEVELDSDDLDHDIILAFDGKDRDGQLLILVNDDVAYRGAVDRRANEFTIPREYLKTGTNYITFIGLPE